MAHATARSRLSATKGVVPVTTKRRYVVVGTGHRVRMYLDAMAGDHRDVAELVGLIEPNPGRLAVHANWLAASGGVDLSR
jgi:predicted dehydrogenase